MQNYNIDVLEGHSPVCDKTETPDDLILFTNFHLMILVVVLNLIVKISLSFQECIISLSFLRGGFSLVSLF